MAKGYKHTSGCTAGGAAAKELHGEFANGWVQ